MGKYVKKYRRGSRDKYSVEQQAGLVQVSASGQVNIQVVPNTSIQGMRKVKHLTVSMAAQESGASTDLLFWALVYVPQGTNPSAISLSGGTGMYEPNQFVMNCGVFDFSAGPLRVFSPISRNLNSGDSIYLLIANPSSVSFNAYYVVRYAVTLQ